MQPLHGLSSWRILAREHDSGVNVGGLSRLFLPDWTGFVTKDQPSSGHRFASLTLRSTLLTKQLDPCFGFWALDKDGNCSNCIVFQSQGSLVIDLFSTRDPLFSNQPAWFVHVCVRSRALAPVFRTAAVAEVTVWLKGLSSVLLDNKRKAERQQRLLSQQKQCCHSLVVVIMTFSDTAKVSLMSS